MYQFNIILIKLVRHHIIIKKGVIALFPNPKNHFNYKNNPCILKLHGPRKEMTLQRSSP
jgi:hypothetical protein